MRTLTSTFASLRQCAALALTLGLAACGGSSQNWDNHKGYVTVTGTVDGFTGGTLALWNNGADKLTVAANGKFEFPLSIAYGSDYSVVVATQPAGQSCSVTNGSGSATGDVRNVAVTCRAYSFVRRALPAIYASGKAVNYSPYRTTDGPAVLEVPSDADILQDLGLLHDAGFNLLRLFGSMPPADDTVAEKILRLANQHYPEMRFQLGTSLHGITTCSDPVNDSNIAYLIGKLSKYPNVATISVGNETSFYSKYMPLPCLEGYIRNIRAQVTQPVTADDDFTFYAGQTAAGGDRVAVKPDTILALIDFASIHLYPISNPQWWNWQQTTVAPGPARAKAMMEAALDAAKFWYGEVASYRYVGAGGLTVTVGDSMPIVVGETGWKAVQTNPASEIEDYTALPENAKWYVDLLYGNAAQGYTAWERSPGGPGAIFYFEATDEIWKRTDDGWGFWDKNRNARYALCGVTGGPACKADLYAGAGYYDPPPFATITFDSPSVTYTLTGFAGAEDSSVVADPTGGTNKVARVVRAGTSEIFAGTVVATAGGLTVGRIPFDASNTRMTVRVFSPAAGIPVRLKVEDSADSTHSVETEATTTVANAWETLTFDIAHPVNGTAAFNPAYFYNRLAIFFNFGTTGASAGAQTYYFDDVTFIGGGGTGGSGGTFTSIGFDSSGVTYTLTGFGGAEDATVVSDPSGGSNLVARVVKSATAELWAGTTISTGANLTIERIPFAAGSTKMSVRVWIAARRHPGAPEGRGRGRRLALGGDRGDHHGRQRLGDAGVRLLEPGHRDALAQPRLHLQPHLDLLRLRHHRCGGRRRHVLLRRRELRCPGHRPARVRSRLRLQQPHGRGRGVGLLQRQLHQLLQHLHRRRVRRRPWRGARGRLLHLPRGGHQRAEQRRVHGHLHRRAGLDHRGADRRGDLRKADAAEDRAGDGRGVVPAGRQQELDRAPGRCAGLLRRCRRQLPHPHRPVAHPERLRHDHLHDPACLDDPRPALQRRRVQLRRHHPRTGPHPPHRRGPRAGRLPQPQHHHQGRHRVRHRLHSRRRVVRVRCRMNRDRTTQDRNLWRPL